MNEFSSDIFLGESGREQVIETITYDGICNTLFLDNGKRNQFNIRSTYADKCIKNGVYKFSDMIFNNGVPFEWNDMV